MVAQKTGYRWWFNGLAGLEENARGLAVLAGGIDSKTVFVRAKSPSLGLALVQERLAQAAAYAVVTHDFDPDREGDARLLKHVTAFDRPETRNDAFKEQIQALYRTLTGVPLPADAAEPAELVTLWSNVYSVSASTTTAWTAVISAVLRDPRVVMY